MTEPEEKFTEPPETLNEPPKDSPPILKRLERLEANLQQLSNAVERAVQGNAQRIHEIEALLGL